MGQLYVQVGAFAAMRTFSQNPRETSPGLLQLGCSARQRHAVDNCVIGMRRVRRAN